MITINLLPKDLRKVERRVVFPYKVYLLRVIAVFVLLHILLFSLNLIKRMQSASLRRSWIQIEPDSKKYASTRQEIKTLEAEVDSVKGFISRGASFTELFSSLNAAIPRGLWLDRFSFSESGLLIQGSVVSLTQNEMSIISRFLQGLKKNEVFASLFSKIELSSVQRRTIKSYDVVDFTLIGDLKKE